MIDGVETQLDQMQIREEERQIARHIWQVIQDWKRMEG